MDGEEFGIGFAVTLPATAAWNCDFMMQGGGGGNGTIHYPTGADYAGQVGTLPRIRCRQHRYRTQGQDGLPRLCVSREG